MAINVKIACFFFCVMVSYGQYYVGAQMTEVTCYGPGSSDCSGEESGSVSYADCCSQANNETDVYFSFEGTCRKCGPVIMDAYPVNVTQSQLILQWSIDPNGLTATRTQVVHVEVGSTVPGFPNVILGDTRSQTFLGLVVGEVYQFEVAVRTENAEERSLPYVLTWRMGKSERPTFKEFTETDVSLTSVTAQWALNCSGYRPMTQMTIQWVEEPNQNPVTQAVLLNFPEENIRTWNFPDASTVMNGMKFNHTFQNLNPGTRYAVLIRGTNQIGTSSASFTIKTDEVVTPETPSSLGLNHGVTLTSCPISVLSATTLLAIFFVKT